MLTRRRPSRSTTGPAAIADSTTGSSAQKATTPASTGLPVLVSTSHGTPINVAASPVIEMTLAASRAVSGRRRAVVTSASRAGQASVSHPGTRPQRSALEFSAQARTGIPGPDRRRAETYAGDVTLSAGSAALG
jgi:hypothetical protein